MKSLKILPKQFLIVFLRNTKYHLQMLRRTFNMDHIALIAVFVLAFLLYGNTIRNGYSLDDTYVTQNNPKVQKGFAGIPEIFTSRYVDEEGNAFGYRPVAIATFAIEYGLWGQNPHISHFINVALYALILIVLLNILRKIFKNQHILFLLFIVLLFAAHPIHTEVVASLKNRETLLSFLFSLAALSSFLIWMDNKQKWFVITGVIFFILAFLSKQDAITFAAIITLALYYYSNETFIPLYKGLNVRKFLASKVYALLAAISFVMFFYASRKLGPLVPTIAYFIVIGFLLIHYVREKPKDKTATCRRIYLLFPVAGVAMFMLAAIYSKLIFALLSLLCFAIFFLRAFGFLKILIARLSKSQLMIVGLLIILCITGIAFYQLPDLYLPVENKVVYHFENPQFVNDPQYSTYPLAFYTLFFYLQKLFWSHPLGFYYGYRMIPEVGWTTPEVIFSLVFHLGILAFALWKLPKKNILSFAILYYLVTISIFTNIVIKIPGIVGERLAFFSSLGFCIAIAYGIFRLLKIDIHAEQISSAKIWLLAGVILIILIPYSVKTINRNQDWKDYLTLFSHDIKYLSNSAKANNVYASQLLKEAYNNEVKNPVPAIQQEYLSLAVKHLKRTVEIDPTYKFAWNNLGFVTYMYMNKKEEGIDYMNKAVQLDPDYKEAHFNLGYAYKQQGDFEQSIQQFNEAQRADPGKILYYTEEADAWYKSGNREKALMVYKKASVLDSTNNQPLIGMGNIYWLSGDTIRAIENWERAFEINPTNIEICNNLLGYYTSKGDAKAEYYKSKVRELQQKSP
jgi:tetratricopeptide (TPR) repeat protein